MSDKNENPSLSEIVAQAQREIAAKGGPTSETIQRIRKQNEALQADKNRIDRLNAEFRRKELKIFRRDNLAGRSALILYFSVALGLSIFGAAILKDDFLLTTLGIYLLTLIISVPSFLLVTIINRKQSWYSPPGVLWSILFAWGFATLLLAKR